MIYTRSGDDGYTTLCGTRISKSSRRCELLGSLDELNCLMGMCAVKAQKAARTISSDTSFVAAHVLAAQRQATRPTAERELPLADIFCEIQHILFVAQALVAGYHKPISSAVATRLEAYIAALEAQVPMPKHFVLAGGNEDAAFYDYVRAVTRRVECILVSFLEEFERERADAPAGVGVDACDRCSSCHAEDYRTMLIFLNRLSSFMYCCARFENVKAGFCETAPRYEVAEQGE